MNSALAHRGPDGSGIWVDASAGIGLGHRRLAVIDLTPAGAQPMLSASGRWIVTFNGEIYGHSDIRRQLEPRAWRGRSDTETLIEAIDAYGPEEAARTLEGMFAWAAWDSRDRVLWLARDRFGEKPLYWSLMGQDFAFASELRSLRRHPAVTSEIDNAALTAYMQLQYVPAPMSILRGVQKLRPGCLLRVQSGRARVIEYWSATAAAVRAIRDPFEGSPIEAVDELHARLSRSVRNRMESDVPMGAFLSGGIDSSLIVALMQAQSPSRVRTFTIGFEQPEFDESGHAARIARHLGTDHCTLPISQADVLSVVPEFASSQDEPFGDSSIIPTMLLARLTRRHVTVAMTGDGGDELFFGYRRYARSARLLSMANRAPVLCRRAIASTAELFAAPSSSPSVKSKCQRIAAFFRTTGAGPAYRILVSQWLPPDHLPINHDDEFRDTRFDEPCMPPWHAVMAIDRVTELHGDILTKVDQASMAVALETRIPILANGVMDFACSLPYKTHMFDGRGKWPMRSLLGRFVPLELYDRPKRGFAAPIGAWLRGPLRPWAEDLLASGRSDPAAQPWMVQIDQAWQEFQLRGLPWHNRLWIALSYFAWRRNLI